MSSFSTSHPSCLAHACRCRGTDAIHWREHRDAEIIWCMFVIGRFRRAVHAFSRESIRRNKPLPPICTHGEVESDCRVCLAKWAQEWAVRQGFSLKKCRHRHKPLECARCRDTCIEACLRNEKAILYKVCPWWKPARPVQCKRAAAAMQDESSEPILPTRTVPPVIDLEEECINLEV